MPRKTPTGGIVIGWNGFAPSWVFFNGSNNNAPPVIGVPYIGLTPVQVVGLAPLYSCTPECRDDFLPDDDKNYVFGNVVGRTPVSTPTYENDFNTWLLKLPINGVLNTCDIILQKVVDDVWTTQTNLVNNNLGINYPISSITGFGTCRGYALNWGEVLEQYGAGIYRVKFSVAIRNGKGQTIGSFCFVSDCFHLRQFTCELAHGTFKVEKWITGKVGDPYEDNLLHDLCGINWYDSYRYNGFFGMSKIPNYEEIRYEYGQPSPGKQQSGRDEAFQRFEMEFNPVKKPILDRFSIFAMIGIGDLRVSDYNINNSDYRIKRVLFVKDSNWEPEWLDEKWVRKGKVIAFFKRGVQNIIATICCDTARPPGSG